jgi:hypothetical protein
MRHQRGMLLSVRIVTSAHGKLCCSYGRKWNCFDARAVKRTASEAGGGQVCVLRRGVYHLQPCFMNVIFVLRRNGCTSAMVWFAPSDIWMLSDVKNLFPSIRCHLYKYSITPVIRTLVIRTANYPDRLGPSGNCREFYKTNLPWNYRLSDRVQYCTVLWLSRTSNQAWPKGLYAGTYCK